MEGEKIPNLEAKGKQVEAYWEPNWTYNCTRNYAQIKALRLAGSLNGIHEEPKKPGKPALITGSGPSLDSFPFEDFAKVRSDFLVIASLSNAVNWIAHGITPDYVVAVDAALGMKKMQFPDYLAHDLRDSVLAIPPIISPDVIEAWQGRITIFRPIQPGMHFIMSTLPLMFADINEHPNMRDRSVIQWFPLGFSNAGCVLNSELTLASYLGCEPIFMAGVNFSFPFGRQVCARYKHTVKGYKKYLIDGIRTPDLIHKTLNGLFTTEEHLTYKLNFYIIWGLTQSLVYNLTPPEDTALAATVPHVTAQEMISNYKVLSETYPDELASDRLPEYVKPLCEAMGLTPPTVPAVEHKPVFTAPGSAVPTIAMPTMPFMSTMPAPGQRVYSVPADLAAQLMAQAQEVKT